MMTSRDSDLALLSDGLQIKEKAMILWRYRWMVFSLTILSTTIIAIMYLLSADRYKSEAVLQVDIRPLHLSSYDQGMGEVGGGQVMQYIETQARLLKSEDVMELLYGSLETRGLPAADGSRSPLSKHPTFAGLQKPDIIEILRRELIVNYSNSNHLINISYESTDARLSHEIVKTIILAYQDVRLNAEKSKLARYYSGVDTNLDERHDEMQAIRDQLTEFYAATSISPGSDLTNPLEKDLYVIREQIRKLDERRRSRLDVAERIADARVRIQRPDVLAAAIERFSHEDMELKRLIADIQVRRDSIMELDACRARLFDAAPASSESLAAIFRIILPHSRAILDELNVRRDRLIERDFIGSELGDQPYVVDDPTVSTYVRVLTDYRLQLQRLLLTYDPDHIRVSEVETVIAQAQSDYYRRVYSVLSSRENEFRAIEIEMKDLIEDQNRLNDEYALTQSQLTRLEALRFRYRSAEEVYNNMWEAKQAAVYTKKMASDNIIVSQNATLPERPSGPKRRRNTVIGFIFSFFGFGLLALLLETLDETIRSKADVETIVQAPLAGILPHIQSSGRDRGMRDLICHTSPRSVASEAFRTLRTTLNLSVQGAPGAGRVLMLTSANQSEGKTTINLNLATIFSQNNLRVLLIDCDLRRPSAHLSLMVPQSPGLSDALKGQCDITDVVIKRLGDNGPDFHLITAGNPPDNPAELLETGKMKDIVKWARDHYDIVLIDTPPVLAVTDSQIIASQVDGVLLTALSGKTRKHAVRRAWELLSEIRNNLIGVILNDVRHESHEYGYGYGYGYGSGYGREGDEGGKRASSSVPAEFSRR